MIVALCAITSGCISALPVLRRLVGGSVGVTVSALIASASDALANVFGNKELNDVETRAFLSKYS